MVKKEGFRQILSDFWVSVLIPDCLNLSGYPLGVPLYQLGGTGMLKPNIYHPNIVWKSHKQRSFNGKKWRFQTLPLSFLSFSICFRLSKPVRIPTKSTPMPYGGYWDAQKLTTDHSQYGKIGPQTSFHGIKWTFSMFLRWVFSIPINIYKTKTQKRYWDLVPLCPISEGW